MIEEDFVFDGLVHITNEEFFLISNLVKSKFGIHLTDQKKALVRGRLNKHIKTLGFDRFQDYYQYIVNDRSGQSLLWMIDKISTNHSYFFREPEHFEFLTQAAVPTVCQILRQENLQDLYIWCAGCATGEEAYTIAMVLYHHFTMEFPRWDISILATDISLSALAYARAGIYSWERVKNVPVEYLKHFSRTQDGRFKVSELICEPILFKRLNLMRDYFPFKKKFHIVFCRNVMIYFDQETRENLVKRIHQVMHETSYLLIGHSESLGRDLSIFKYIQPAVYKRC